MSVEEARLLLLKDRDLFIRQVLDEIASGYDVHTFVIAGTFIERLSALDLHLRGYSGDPSKFDAEIRGYWPHAEKICGVPSWFCFYT